MVLPMIAHYRTAILLHIRASTDRDFLKKLTKKLTNILFIFNNPCKIFTKNIYSKCIDIYYK
nr:MAG TPA: hypothetical protein [Caudoviricetes sp.]